MDQAAENECKDFEEAEVDECEMEEQPVRFVNYQSDERLPTNDTDFDARREYIQEYARCEDELESKIKSLRNDIYQTKRSSDCDIPIGGASGRQTITRRHSEGTIRMQTPQIKSKSRISCEIEEASNIDFIDDSRWKNFPGRTAVDCERVMDDGKRNNCEEIMEQLNCEQILEGKNNADLNKETDCEEELREIDTKETMDSYGEQFLGETITPQKYPFKLKQSENGNILTIHHTVREEDKFIRIRMAACCFNRQGSKFVTVDKRGNIFIFDLSIRKYWRLFCAVPKVSIIRQSVVRPNEYLIGTKLGQLLLVDVTQQNNSKSLKISADSIEQISFPGQPLQPSQLALVHAGTQAILINLHTFKATHRLDFNEVNFSLKFASFVPHSDQILSCFTNDSLHIWSGVTLNTLRIIYPIKLRDRKLKFSSPESIPEIDLTPYEQTSPYFEEFHVDCEEEDYVNGLISAYAFTRDSNSICLTTFDKYLLLLSAHTYDIQRCIRLKGFTITSCAFLSNKPNEQQTLLLLALTNIGQVVLIDCLRTEYKLIVHSSNTCRITICDDAKLFAALMNTGEAYIWTTCKLYNVLKTQQHCFQMVQQAFKQKKPLAVSCDPQNSINMDLKKLLKRERLIAILMEFGSYPAKYRAVIWSSLLQLPGNNCQFQELIKMGVPQAVKERAGKLNIKQDSQRCLLIKIWSCLAHWCKMFAYSDFLPALIFPFTKIYPKNALVAFEVCASLLLNHFSLWFEFHPLEPANYLGMCSNVLQYFDRQLYDFYSKHQIEAKDFAWSLLANAFSVTLDADQWLCVWDHIITYPAYFPVFCVVAINQLHREVVLRMPNPDALKQFFNEQSVGNVRKLILKARCMSVKCPTVLHPSRYMREFTPIPKGVYPKFLNFPKQWVEHHEQELIAYKKQQSAMDARLRELELEEHQMMERLEVGLRAEAHVKRIKEMEQIYQTTLKREEERIADQRKMLLMYQKEIRNRKGEVLSALQESERRKKVVEMERELEALMHDVNRERIRNASNVIMAEDDLRNQEFEVIMQKCIPYPTYAPTLSEKYRSDFENLCQQKNLLGDNLTRLQELRKKPKLPEITNLDVIEQNIDAIQKEFSCLLK